MSRVVSLLIVAVLLLGLLIALDPQARAQAGAMVRDLGPTVRNLNDAVVTVTPTPASNIHPPASTPGAYATPVPTVQDDNNEDSSKEPIIVINWDALNDALHKLWNNLRIRFQTDLKQDNK